MFIFIEQLNNINTDKDFWILTLKTYKLSCLNTKQTFPNVQSKPFYICSSGTSLQAAS